MVKKRGTSLIEVPLLNEWVKKMTIEDVQYCSYADIADGSNKVKIH